MKIKVGTYEQTMWMDNGAKVEGIVAKCSRCNHETESYGTGEASYKRCLALLRKECPRGENNFYAKGGQEVWGKPFPKAGAKNIEVSKQIADGLISAKEAGL